MVFGVNEALYIGLDCSTTSAKAVVWTETGEAVAEGRAAIDCSAPKPGYAEQSAEDWVRASGQAIRECVASLCPDAVRALGITCQRETFVLLDGAGAPLRPAILWYDSRATAELDELRGQLDVADYHLVTGKQLDITSAVARMLWLQRHEPHRLEQTRCFADVLGYLSLALTGNLRTVHSGVDTTGLVGLATQDWLPEHLRICGLTAVQMPELVAPCAPLGPLTPRAAADCGLPAGTPVIAAGGDGHCFALAATLCEPGAATLTLGTSAVLGMTLTEPVTGAAFRTLLACAPGRYVLESVIQCGSATLSWADRHFLQASTHGVADPELAEAAVAKVPPGSAGLLALPYWRGVRVPHNDPLACGVVVGWREVHTFAHFRRAIMEGMAFEFAQLQRMICDATGRQSSCLVVGGGGAQSDTWCQILADVLNLRVVRPETVELSSLGAALCAFTAHARQADPYSAVKCLELGRDVFVPDSGRLRGYTDLAAVYARLYHSTRDICHQLSGNLARGAK